MSKQLLLVRHAKSSWADFSIKDFDRPLNDRGRKDAPMMAQRLLDRGVGIDAFVSSPAKRAKKTAEYFAKAYDQPKDAILFIEELYLATPEVFARVVSRLPESQHSIAIFSHNDGITSYANILTNTRVDDMPTCSIFCVSAEVDSWKDFANAPRKFLFFDYPKLA